MKQIIMIKYVLRTVIVILQTIRHKKNINNHIMIQVFVFLPVKINCIIDTNIVGTMIIIFVVMIMNKKDAIVEQQVHQFTKCIIHIIAKTVVV